MYACSTIPAPSGVERGRYSAGVKYDPDRVSGLANMRRPDIAGELIQYIQMLN